MLQLQSSWLLWIWPHWRQAAHSLPTDRLPHSPSRSTAVLIDNTNCGRLCWWPRCGDRFSQWEGRRSWRATRVSGNKVHVIHQRKTLKKLHNCNPPEEVFLVNTALIQFELNTPGVELLWEKIKIYLHFLSFFNTKVALLLKSLLMKDKDPLTNNAMAVGDLMKLGASPSAALVLTLFSCNIPSPAPSIWTPHVSQPHNTLDILNPSWKFQVNEVNATVCLLMS